MSVKETPIKKVISIGIPISVCSAIKFEVSASNL